MIYNDLLLSNHDTARLEYFINLNSNYGSIGPICGPFNLIHPLILILRVYNKVDNHLTRFSFKSEELKKGGKKDTSK